MAVQYSTGFRNDRLDALETRTGAEAVLTIWSGSVPANCSVANSGTLLVSMLLPTDYMATATSGTKSKSGTWQDTAADASGIAGHFRLFANSTTNSGECVLQGNCTSVGGGGDMELDNISISSGQQVTVTSFIITAGNA